MDFTGLSRESLQQAMLNRMGRIADLRKASRRFRQDLYTAQKELQQVQEELRVINELLERIVAFPSTPNIGTVVEMPVRSKKRA